MVTVAKMKSNRIRRWKGAAGGRRDGLGRALPPWTEGTSPSGPVSRAGRVSCPEAGASQACVEGWRTRELGSQRGESPRGCRVQGWARTQGPPGGGRRGSPRRRWAEGRDPALGGDQGLGGGREGGGTVGGCCDNEGSRIRETEGYVGRSGRSGRLPKVMPAGSAGGLAVDIHRKGGKEVNPFPVMDN